MVNSKSSSNLEFSRNTSDIVFYVRITDKYMAVYIVVFVIWLVWMPMGLNKRLGAQNNSCDDSTHYVDVSIACGYTYFSFVGIAFTCSLCCLRG